jgi:hypothetical protein
VRIVSLQSRQEKSCGWRSRHREIRSAGFLLPMFPWRWWMGMRLSHRVEKAVHKASSLAGKQRNQRMEAYTWMDFGFSGVILLKIGVQRNRFDLITNFKVFHQEMST